MSNSTNRSKRNQGLVVSLRIKFAIFLSLIIIVSCSGLSYFFLRNQANTMASELERLGSVLVKNLAYNSRYAVFIEDEDAISQLIDGVMKVDQVVYVVVTGAEGQILAADSKGRLSAGEGIKRDPEVPLYPDPSHTFALLTTPTTEPVITSFSTGGITVEGIVSRGKGGTIPVKKTIGAESVRDFALPVVRLELPESRSLELLQQQGETAFKQQGSGVTREVYGVVRVGLTTEPMERALANSIWKAVWLAITIILIGIVSTFILSTRVTQPLRRLAAVAQRIAEGDLSASVPSTTADEVGQLTQSFNRMTDGLKKRDEDISQHIATITRQVRELSTLNKVGTAITSTLEPEKLLTTVLSILTEEQRFARALVMLYSAERGIAYSARVVGVSEQLQRAARRMEIPISDPDTVEGSLLLHGRSMLIPDVAAPETPLHPALRRFPTPLPDVVGPETRLHPALRSLFTQLGVRAPACAPLKSKQRILGFIAADKGAEPCTREELDLLTTIANSIGIAVDNALAYHQLESLNVTLEAKVRERTGELEAANQRLQEMDRLKTDFFANISHELRTPLTLIVGAFNTLLKQPPTALNEEILQAGLRNTSRLLFLINELLDLARFESGRVEVHKRCVDLTALTRRVAANFESSHGRRIHLRGMVRPVLAEVDPRGMKTVVYNLLSNALKFSDPQEGQAWIQLREHDDTVVLEVEDNGIGIPPEHLDRIFDRFTQVDSSAARRHEGSGIGLAHVNEIVTQHGGRITVESEQGRGSVFTITLPRGNVRPEDVAPLDEQEDSFIVPVEAPASAVASQWGGTLVPEGPEAPLILVADDNADMRTYLVSILGRQYRVLQAQDGVEALEQTRSQRPDLIVTDVMMPRMSGYDLLQALKNDQDLRTIPVIFVTAMVETEAQIESLQAGADDYIAKPFNESVVLARVGNLLKARLQQREIANLQQERLLRFLPPQIGQLVVSGTADEFLKGHRAEVTALFVDLRGFTAFTETAEPEDSTALLHEFHAEMGRLIADSQGTLTHLAGDSMMVLFNDPVPLDNHAEIAVRLALAMQERIGELKHTWAQRGFQLGAGVGIATGYATVGIIGLEGRQEYTAIGSVINLAARLCAEAQDGQVLVPERVLTLIAGRVEADHAGDLTLKGLQSPIATYNVTGWHRTS